MPVVWEETHEVTAVGANGITVRVTLKGPTRRRRARGSARRPGRRAHRRADGHRDAPLRRRRSIRYRFPLAPGETWNQWVDNFNETTNKAGQINRYVRVGGWEKVSTPAGAFDAIRMRVLMRLDDEEFWRYPTTCNYSSGMRPPSARRCARRRRREYFERGDELDGQGAIRAQHTLLELTSYSPGGR